MDWELIGQWIIGLFFVFLFFGVPLLLVLDENVKYRGKPWRW